MKKAYFISILCALPFLFMTGSALAQPVPGCDRTVEQRLETADAALEVDALDYHYVINYWAEQGSGEDGIGFDGAVYEESVLRNFTRMEMWLYLEKIFNWSSDMVLETGEWLFQNNPDGSAIYMAVNKWYGTTEAGYYEQPGISVFHFRPGEGCIAYQRDYFSEGDTWYGMSVPGWDAQSMVVDRRNTIITELGLTDKCVDDDGDGFTKYAAAAGCPEGDVVDCDDYHYDIRPIDLDEDGYYDVDGPCPGDDCDDGDETIHPGAPETKNDGIDSNCNGKDNCATFPVTPEGPLDLLPFFALFLVPAVYGFVLKRRLARSRMK
jgi:hypothetical protein